MSMAENMPIFGSLAGSAAEQMAPDVAAPHTRATPRVRVATRRARAVGGPIVFATAIWLMAMSLAVVVVWRNTLVQQETSAITQGKDQLNLLQQQNRELQDQLVKATAATTIQDWALAHGMQRAVTFKSVAADPTAVAPLPAPPAPVAANPPPARGLLGKLGELVSLVLGTHPAAAQP